MNSIDLIPFLYGKFALFVLVFTRISALFSTFFLFRSQLINARITIAISAILSVYTLVLFPHQTVPDGLFSMAVMVAIVEQFFIGFVGGLVLNLVFEIVTMAGQIFSTQAGLAMASVIDPLFGQITQLTQFYTFAMVFVFLLVNGHLLMIETLMQSFSILPIDQLIQQKTFLSDILNYSSVLFVGAISLSISIIVAILILNLSLAAMTRFAPQFNVFSIGINLSLMLGIICIYLFLICLWKKAKS